MKYIFITLLFSSCYAESFQDWSERRQERKLIRRTYRTGVKEMDAVVNQLDKKQQDNLAPYLEAKKAMFKLEKQSAIAETRSW